MARPKKIYAVYTGDKFESVGTLEEVAAELGIRPKSVLDMTTDSYKKRAKVNGRMAIVVGKKGEEGL